MYTLHKILLTAVAACGVARGLGQAPQLSSDKLAARTSAAVLSFYKKYPAEKVFVHINQPVYSSGETIWYKVYTMAYGKPSALSGVVYIQLSDTAGKVVTQNMLRLVDGKAHGNIGIDPGTKSGWYKLTAFTSWMMNFDHQAYFSQEIYIHNASSPGSFTQHTSPPAGNYNIDFFPEGGDLLSGAICRVAFKATSNEGMPAIVHVTIRDNANKAIASITTLHDGMGDFTFEPEAGTTYKAIVEFPDGSKQSIRLPEVKSEGFAIKAAQYADKIRLTITHFSQQKKTEHCFLTTVQNKGVIQTYPLNIANGFNEIDLLKTGFSTGILRISLFNEQGLPVSERLVFINQHDLDVSAPKADQMSFQPDGLNTISLAIKDQANVPVQGNFSIAVTDGDASTQSCSENIYSGLLLSPELRGAIYNPGYYFSNADDSLARQLDLVMLTNGWRRFNWQKILNNEYQPLVHPVEHSLYLAGKIVNYKSPQAGNPLSVKLLVFNGDSTKFMGYATPDSTGSFVLKDFNHTGLSDVYMQVANKKGRAERLKTELFSTAADSLRRSKSSRFSPVDIDDLASFISRAQAEARMRALSDNILLKQVDIKARKLSPTEAVIAAHVNPRYTSERQFTIDLVSDPPGVDMPFIEYLRGRIPNLVIIGNEDSPQFIYRGGSTLGSPGGNSSGGPSSGANSKGGQQITTSTSNVPNPYLVPYFYLNNAPASYDDLRYTDLRDIALIQFMPPPVWFVPFNGGNDGAIMVYLKNQSDEIKQLPGVADEYDHFIFNGYSVTREFSAPDHVSLRSEGLLDNRITLYWNHDLETDSTGILKFSFRNTDVAKKFNVVIQGMDDQGRLLYIQKTFY